ncbi:MAG TPA: hypothetical protein VMU42_19505 [Candidatus Sulfotelmatobacter sp.]|nr:hypothetical protein [Candidatus Sulfotelmatobacter sp.]
MAPAIALSAMLGGCHAIPLAAIGGAGAAGGWLAASRSALADADAGLAIVKPINQALCVTEQARPHGPRVAAALAAFCRNLPSDVGGLLVQAAAIHAAIRAERAAPGPDQTEAP